LEGNVEKENLGVALIPQADIAITNKRKKRKKKKTNKVERNGPDKSGILDNDVSVSGREQDVESAAKASSAGDELGDPAALPFLCQDAINQYDASLVVEASPEETPLPGSGCEEQEQSPPGTRISLEALEHLSHFSAYEDLHASGMNTGHTRNVSIRGTFLHVHIPKSRSSQQRSKSEDAKVDRNASDLSFSRYVDACHFQRSTHLYSSHCSWDKLSGITKKFRNDTSLIHQCIDKREMSSFTFHLDLDEDCSALSTTHSVVRSHPWLSEECCPNSSTVSTTTPPPSDVCTPISSPLGGEAQVVKIACCDQDVISGESLWTNQHWPKENHGHRRECDHNPTPFMASRRHMHPQTTNTGSGSIIAQMRRRANGEFALATDVNRKAVLDSRSKDVLGWRPTLRHMRTKEATPAR
jgi:hypothetical protein